MRGFDWDEVEEYLEEAAEKVDFKTVREGMTVQDADTMIAEALDDIEGDGFIRSGN